MVYRILFSLMLCFVFSCSSEKPKGKTAAEALYNEARDLYENERYLLATEKLNSLKAQYPYSYFATHAELLIADILYMQESYVESAAAYQTFRDLHPKHEKIDYVVYKIAESYYNQLPDTIDRDLSPAVDAIKFYKELIAKYPKYDAKIARERIADCEKRLKQKEKYIADFYFRVEKYDAASYRYYNIAKEYEGDKLGVYAKRRSIESAFLAKDYTACIKNIKMFSPNDNDNKKFYDEFLKKCSQEYRKKLSVQ